MKPHPLVFAAVLASAACASAAQKFLIGYGWEFLAVTTEDVHRNRAKFAATGLDGILIPVERSWRTSVRRCTTSTCRRSRIAATCAS